MSVWAIREQGDALLVMDKAQTQELHQIAEERSPLLKEIDS